MLKSVIYLKYLIKYSAIPKGENDIQIVHDTTTNKLNEYMWIPSFWLPTLDSLLHAFDENSWMADRDIAEKVLNFQWHASVVPYTGVNLGPMYEEGEEVENRMWAFWDINLRC